MITQPLYVITHPCNFDNTSEEIKETDKKGSKIEILLHGGLLCAMVCGKNNKLTTPQPFKKNLHRLTFLL